MSRPDSIYGTLSGTPPGVTAVGVVVDRAMAAIAADPIRKLGGAWQAMFDLWRSRDDFSYLVMLADTRKRIKRRAPYTLLVLADDGLSDALNACCDRLDDVKCAWMLCVEPGSEAEAVVRSALLADAVPEGRA